jgi:serine phosphatase RsbU (regulator of sigma subunit)
VLKRLLLFSFLFIGWIHLFSQEENYISDSLKVEISKTKNKEEIIQLYKMLINHESMNGFGDSIRVYLTEIKPLLDFSIAQDRIQYLWIQADVEYILMNFEMSEKFYLEAIDLAIKEGLNEEKFLLYGDIANIYSSQSNSVLSNSYLFDCIPYYKQTGDKEKLATTYNQIGFNYEQHLDFQSSIAYIEKAYELSSEINNIDGMSAAKINIGFAYEKSGDFEKAKKAYYESVDLHKQLGVDNYIGYSYVLIGGMYVRLDELDSALFYIKKSEELLTNPDDIYGLSFVYLAYARYFDKVGDVNAADRFANKSLELSRIDEFLDNEIRALDFLHGINVKRNQYKDAYINFKRLTDLRDSIFSPMNTKEIAGLEYKFKYETKAAKDSLQFEEDKKIANIQHAEEVKRYWVYGVSGLIIGAFLILLLLFIYRGSKQKQKRNTELEFKNKLINEQKLIVEEKNSEILDSIAYAKRIQSAILPPLKAVKSNLPNSFILYKPKDIVAGDFYWMETYSAECRVPSAEETQDGIVGAGNSESKIGHLDSVRCPTILLAAADCTGHGVPGAMVSVVCNNGLNRAVREHKLSDPAEILNKTREIVIQEFEKSEEEVKDGMDIALVSLSPRSPNDSRGAGSSAKLSYAGAHNPLWIIRKDAQEIEVIKADKQPIGKFRNAADFTTRQLVLNPGDTFYLFTDGFADQFGGEDMHIGKKGGKKLKSGNFKKLLLSICKEEMHQQKISLNDYFEKWRGDLEQIDDVCVIGVRV